MQLRGKRHIRRAASTLKVGRGPRTDAVFPDLQDSALARSRRRDNVPVKEMTDCNEADSVKSTLVLVNLIMNPQYTLGRIVVKVSFQLQFSFILACLFSVCHNDRTSANSQLRTGST